MQFGNANMAHFFLTVYFFLAAVQCVKLLGLVPSLVLCTEQQPKISARPSFAILHFRHMAYAT